MTTAVSRLAALNALVTAAVRQAGLARVIQWLVTVRLPPAMVRIPATVRKQKQDDARTGAPPPGFAVVRLRRDAAP